MSVHTNETITSFHMSYVVTLANIYQEGKWPRPNEHDTHSDVVDEWQAESSEIDLSAVSVVRPIEARTSAHWA